jgi:hypothetical protein
LSGHSVYTTAMEAKPSSSSVKVPEYSILLLGQHKQPLFEKICSVSEKYERHMQYSDTYYLNFTVDENPCVVELSDPGVEHTGAREMAIRKADAIILCYAMHNAASFHKLPSVAEDFELRKGKYPPVVVICNEDEIIATDEEMASTAESASEGYESEDTSKLSVAEVTQHNSGKTSRRASMENIRNAYEECPVTKEQGENLAKLFGPDAQFLSLSFSEYDGAGELMECLIQRIRSHTPYRRKKSSATSLSALRRKSMPPLSLLPFKSSKEKLSSRSDREESSSQSSLEVRSSSPVANGVPQQTSGNSPEATEPSSPNENVSGEETSNAEQQMSSANETSAKTKSGHGNFAKNAATRAMRKVNKTSNICSIS